MIIFSKILAIILAAMVISKTYLDLKKHREVLTTFLFWTIAWIAVVYVALDPGLFIKIVNKLSDSGTGFGTFFGLAFIFLFFITYRIYTKANRLEQQIKEIVMKIGIKEIKE